MRRRRAWGEHTAVFGATNSARRRIARDQTLPLPFVAVANFLVMFVSDGVAVDVQWLEVRLAAPFLPPRPPELELCLDLLRLREPRLRAPPPPPQHNTSCITWGLRSATICDHTPTTCERVHCGGAHPPNAAHSHAITLAQIDSGSPSPLFLVERLCMSIALELPW